MTPREVRATLDRLGLNKSEAARLCGVDTTTMQRWCTDSGPQFRQIPKPAARLLYAIERLPELRGILEWHGSEKYAEKPKKTLAATASGG